MELDTDQHWAGEGCVCIDLNAHAAEMEYGEQLFAHLRNTSVVVDGYRVAF